MYSKAGVASVPALQGLRGGPWGPVRTLTAVTKGTQEEASIIQLQQLSAHRDDSSSGTQSQGAGEGWVHSGRDRGPLAVAPEALQSVVKRQRQRIAELTAEVGELRQVRGSRGHTQIGLLTVEVRPRVEIGCRVQPGG